MEIVDIDKVLDDFELNEDQQQKYYQQNNVLSFSSHTQKNDKITSAISDINAKYGKLIKVTRRKINMCMTVSNCENKLILIKRAIRW